MAVCKASLHPSWVADAQCRPCKAVADRARRAKRRPALPPARAQSPAVHTRTQFLRSDQDLKALEQTTDFFVTSAVQNSEADGPALRALELAAEECSGRIHVTPIRYVNPTRQNEIRPDEQWAPALEPYLLESEVRPHPNLAFMTRKSAATTNNPLPVKLNGRTQDRSAIFGHPQLAMRTVATPQHKLPKIYYSSGAITEARGAYSDTDAGDMAEFHHSLAAIKVEIRGRRFHLRELIWDGYQFADIDRAYTPHGVVDLTPPAALVMGDWHEGATDPQVERATFGPGGIVESCQPEQLIVHDLADNLECNPHEVGRSLISATRANQTVADHIAAVSKRLAQWGGLEGLQRVVVVPSNHDDFLRRWLESGKAEPKDRELHAFLTYRMLREHRLRGAFPNALELAVREAGDLPDHVRFLKLDESYRVRGVELGMHGHLGPNGARGSIRNLAQIGTRSIIGHVHSPGIWQGVVAVGTSSNYRLGYNAGPSSWLQSHCLLFQSGYRQLLHIIEGSWRG